MPVKPYGVRHTFVDRDPLIRYPVFDLVRNPSLLLGGRERDIQELWHTVERYRAQLEPLGVLQDLSPQLQKELAALVLDLDVRYQAWTNHRAYNQRLKVRSRRGPGHVRKLARKLRQIKAALEAVAGDAHKVDEEFADAVVPHVRAALVNLARVTLVPPGQTVQQFTARMSGFYEQSRNQRLQSDVPRALAATQLFEHLHGSGGLPGLDAYVRTAKIGNAFWAWGYPISENDLGVKECPAIRMLISRHQRRLTTAPGHRNAHLRNPQRPSDHGTRKKRSTENSGSFLDNLGPPQ